MKTMNKTISKKNKKNMISRSFYLNNVENGDSDEEDNTCSVHTSGCHVYFHSPVTRSSCFKLIDSLKKANNYIQTHNIHCEFDKLDTIYLHILSDGGEVYPAMNVVDVIQSFPTKIITVAEGCVASAGVLISLSARERWIRKNAYMLIHEIRSGCVGKYSECQDDMDNNDLLMNNLKEYIINQCCNEKLNTKLSKQLKRDLLWSAKKCMKYGLIHKVIN